MEMMNETKKAYELEPFFANVGCIIMASGLGKRFGGNKLMADFLGKPMMEYILDATEGLCEKRVVITRHEEVAELCRKKNVRVVVHDLPHRSDAVRLGMEAIGEAEGYLFCPADQPLLRRDTVKKLIGAAMKKQEEIWRVGSQEFSGAPVLFPKWCQEELRTLPEGKGGSWILKKYPTAVKIFYVDNGHELMDVDTQETLKFLESYALEVEYFGKK